MRDQMIGSDLPSVLRQYVRGADRDFLEDGWLFSGSR